MNLGFPWMRLHVWVHEQRQVLPAHGRGSLIPVLRTAL